MNVLDFASSDLKTSYCIDLDTRDLQVKESLARIPGRIGPVNDHDGHIAVVCYGPSLEDTWEKLKGFKHIITCSGAHKFLIDRGIIPTFHCEVDPRPHKAELIGVPHKDVEYLVASVCHKEVFDLLEGFNVKLWHVFSHEAGRDKVPYTYPHDEWLITGGSNVGVRAMSLARFLGFKKMTLFGMDYSFKNDGTQHAGWHPKEINGVHAVEASGEIFYTSPPMHHYAQEFFREVQKLGDIQLEVEGNGLLQAQIREHLKTKPLIPPQEKMAMIAATSPKVISPEYVEQNRLLHETNPAYGISGAKRADTVRKLIDKLKPQTVLDYGCGKGTLAQSLSIPIWEYDPAIPGKDKPPRPADLVICTDVMEHVEPEYLDAFLLDLARVTLKVCYAIIYTDKSQKNLPDGRNTHLIQKRMDWWKETLEKFFSVAKIEQSGPEVMVILGPKKKLEVEPQKNNVVAPALDFSKRTTPARYDGTEVRFHTPNEQTLWRARTLFTKEPATIQWIDTFKPGETLYDIGANVGGYTVWASKRRGVKVFAFEPESGNYSLLCRNMTLNDVDGSAYCVAVTDSLSVDTIYLSSQEPGGSCHTFGEMVGPDMRPRQTAIKQGMVGMSLDSVFSFGLPYPDHIKIDVDGMEHKVINGMSTLLASGRVKSLLVEVNTNLTEHLEMLDVIQSYGFSYDLNQAQNSMRKEGPFKGCAEYVFSLPQKPNPVEDYVLEKINKAAIIETPFPHLYIEDVFPQDFTVSLANDYKSLEEARGTKGYPQRFVASPPSNLDWMTNGKLRSLLDHKFGTKSKTDETMLLRDLPGYQIGPHTDTPKKTVSALFYLTGDHGTSIYVPLIPSFTDPKGSHHPREGFRLAWSAPGKPNSAFIFARTDKSFHGTEPFTGEKRDILLYDARA